MSIRKIHATFQTASRVLQELRKTNDETSALQLKKISATYEQKVGVAHWGAGSSVVTLVVSGVFGIAGAAAQSDLLKAIAPLSAKTDEIFKSVLHGDDIRHDKDLKLEDDSLSKNKELERQANQLEEQLGRTDSQLMQQEAEMSRAK